MALHEAALEPYRHWEPRLVLALTAGIVFLENVVIAWQTHLRLVLEHTMTLSSVEWFVFVLGPFLVEPVLLFGALYYASSRADLRPSLLAAIPGLVGAVLVGSYLGQAVGGDLWVLRHGFVRFAGLDLVGAAIESPFQLLLYLREGITPVVRDVLTVVAALGLARARCRDTSPGGHGGVVDRDSPADR